MFWSLVLAHLVADYPLQTAWMVEAKKQWWGLTWHVLIHLLTMLIIVGAVRSLIWPNLLVLTLIHFGVDTGKNLVSKYKSQWVIAPYLMDQVFHFLSILLVAVWIAHGDGRQALAVPSPWVIYVIAYVAGTYVWFITERVLTYTNKGYQQLVTGQAWSRMFSRAAWCTGLLLGWGLWGLIVIALTLVFRLFHLSGEYRWCTFSIDTGVALVMMISVQLTLALF